MTAHTEDPALSVPCPVCGSKRRQPCIALDHLTLPSDHPERQAARASAQEPTPIYESLSRG